VDDDEPVGPTTFFDATLTVGGVAQTPFLEFNEGPIQSEGHITGGVKFDEIAEGDDPIVIMFFSDRSPVWHNLFVKAGSVGIGNTGLFDDFLTNMNLTTIDFIPTPNSGTVIPAPAALPAGLALMGLVALRRRNKA